MSSPSRRAGATADIISQATLLPLPLLPSLTSRLRLELTLPLLPPPLRPSRGTTPPNAVSPSTQAHVEAAAISEDAGAEASSGEFPEAPGVLLRSEEQEEEEEGLAGWGSMTLLSRRRLGAEGGEGWELRDRFWCRWRL